MSVSDDDDNDDEDFSDEDRFVNSHSGPGMKKETEVVNNYYKIKCSCAQKRFTQNVYWNRSVHKNHTSIIHNTHIDLFKCSSTRIILNEGARSCSQFAQYMAKFFYISP